MFKLYIDFMFDVIVQVIGDGPNVSDIKKDGYLGRKNNSLLRSWKNPWAELANNHLYFFKDSQSKKVYSFIYSNSLKETREER